MQLSILVILALAASSASATVVERAPVQGRSSAAEIETGGFATYYSQGGLAGACGAVHSDFDRVAAIAVSRYGNPSTQSPLCGRQVQITNVNNNLSVIATITDECPACVNNNSFDLSVGSFDAIASLSEGIVPISWFFL